MAALDQLVELIADRRLIGIVGAPGAGKSTLAAELAARLNNSAQPRSSVVLPMDGFHLPQARLRELGARDRMGAPDTFDISEFERVLRAVRLAESTTLAPGFNRTAEEPVSDAISIPANASHVIVEGNYLLLDSDGWQAIAPLLDLTVFITLDRAVRQQRLIDRHMRYGKPPDEALAWALGTDERNAVVIEASASRADHVLRVD